MSWMLGLGDALQAFGRAKMMQDEERRRQAHDDRQFQLQQEQLRRALSRDQLQDQRYQQEEDVKAAERIIETGAPGMDLSGDMSNVLSKGGYGHMTGTQVQGNIPSQFTSPALRPDVGRPVLQPTRRDVQMRDAQLAEQQQRAEQQAWEQQKFDEMKRQFGVEQANNQSRWKMQFDAAMADNNRPLSPSVLAQALSSFVANAETPEAGQAAFNAVFPQGERILSGMSLDQWQTQEALKALQTAGPEMVLGNLERNRVQLTNEGINVDNVIRNVLAQVGMAPVGRYKR